MAYHKFQAQQLFTGTEMLDASQVLITDEEGLVQAIIPQQDAGEGIQQMQGTLSPGFINCHCHLELSHMKGLIPGKTGLVDFVLAILQLRHFPEEEILEAIARGEEEMLQNGIVAVGDISNNALSFQQKQKRRLQYYNFIEVSGFHESIAQFRFDKALEVYTKMVTISNAVSIVPHAPYSLSRQLLAMVNNHSAGKLISIHNQETQTENDFFVTGKGDFRRLYDTLKVDISTYEPTGKSSLQTYLPQLNKVGNLLLVHNTCTTEEDLLFAKQACLTAGRNAYWALCVNANLYIEDKLPPVDLLRQQNCKLVIGTDSLASNYSLSVLDEMITIRKNFPSIPEIEILQWATLNGAEALQTDTTLGSFEKGKKPGVLCLENDWSSLKRLF